MDKKICILTLPFLLLLAISCGFPGSELNGQNSTSFQVIPQPPLEKTTVQREITELKFSSVDGTVLPAVLSMPREGSNFPLVVTVHGGNGDRGVAFVRTLAEPSEGMPTLNMLSEQPWAIFALDYRKGFFGMEEDDVVAGIRFAKSLPRINSKKVAVYGGSHGGQLALRAAQLMGKDFTCVVAGSPWCTNPQLYLFGDLSKPPLSEIATEPRNFISSTRQALLLPLQKKMPEAEIEKLLSEKSVEANAARILVPALFLNSNGDQLVPRVLVEPTVSALRKSGGNVTEYIAEKSLHVFYWGRDVDGLSKATQGKTPQQLEEEAVARGYTLGFLKRWLN